MTLAEIQAMDVDFLTVKQVADCLHCSPQLVRDEATKSPHYFGFPIAKIGHAHRIPRLGFICWCLGQVPVLQIISSNQLFRGFEKMGIE